MEGAVQGLESDILHPFEDVEPIVADLRGDRVSPKQNGVVYHQV
jgi:hypothetical protein